MSSLKLAVKLELLTDVLEAGRYAYCVNATVLFSLLWNIQLFLEDPLFQFCS